jgi:hypothetical protein
MVMNPTAFTVRILEITGLDDVLPVEAAAVTYPRGVGVPVGSGEPRPEVLLGS